MSENKPDATAALAQTDDSTSLPPGEEASRSDQWGAHASREKRRHPADDQFCLGAPLMNFHDTRPYERRPGDPVYRPLQIFTLDPSISKLQGAIATLKVPYERLQPGPKGAVFEVDNFDGFQHNKRVDLDDSFVLMNSGLDPTPTDPRFHQQMVYAVASSVYATFRTALGRHITWSFPNRGAGECSRLVLRPHALPGARNAFYDKESGSIQFGYFRAAAQVAGRNLPQSWVFTCLSHDIVAHEVTHALLDGLRANFTLPTNPDVPGFHEALADLVAVFQHFSYRDVLERAIASSRSKLQMSPLLTDLAWQFSQSQGGQYGHALRSAVERKRKQEKRLYGQDREPHELGSILVGAVFEAFTTVYERKVKRYIGLATDGSGILREGDLSPALVAVLAEQAAHLASQFLSICIRAVDYCPPVDLRFGEYLRALITADVALVPDDPWFYREALVDAFRSHGIHPADVPNLSEDALLWRAPEEMLPPCAELTFAKLRFRGDPSNPASAHELQCQARHLGRFITAPGRSKFFGLVDAAAAERERLSVSKPCIHSVRTTRRVGPQGQIVFDLVAEVTQTRQARTSDGSYFPFYGGSTIILDPEGAVRYVVAKGVRSEVREQEQRQFMFSREGRRIWMKQGRELAPKANMFCLLHDSRES